MEMSSTHVVYSLLTVGFAAEFADNPAVLGYDILNEPAGSQRYQIQALWEDAAKVIRKRDPDGILFLTPQFLLGVVCGLQCMCPARHI
jgi:Cellulase (glycosyl hydrolase family 5)